jgi:hypothetical protein
MKITCPGCGWNKDVPDERVPAGGAKGTCPQCKTKFEVTPPQKHIEEQIPINTEKDKSSKLPIFKKLNNKAKYHILFLVLIVLASVKWFITEDALVGMYFCLAIFAAYTIFIIRTEVRKFDSPRTNDWKYRIVNGLTMCLTTFFVLFTLFILFTSKTTKEDLVKQKMQKVAKLKADEELKIAEAVKLKAATEMEQVKLAAKLKADEELKKTEADRLKAAQEIEREKAAADKLKADAELKKAEIVLKKAEADRLKVELATTKAIQAKLVADEKRERKAAAQAANNQRYAEYVTTVIPSRNDSQVSSQPRYSPTSGSKEEVWQYCKRGYLNKLENPSSAIFPDDPMRMETIRPNGSFHLTTEIYARSGVLKKFLGACEGNTADYQSIQIRVFEN